MIITDPKPMTLRGKRARSLNAEKGFTLIGLMISIVIMGIIMAVAVPSFEGVQLTSKLRSFSNKLIADAQLARSEAIKRSTVVRMCVSSDGASCSSGDWNQGWIVYVPADGTIINQQAALDASYKITGTAPQADFQPTGVGAVQINLTICRSSPSAGSQERIVSISATGRPRVTKTETGTCS